MPRARSRAATRGKVSPVHLDPPQVRSRAWLEWRGRSLLGQGRLNLLERIEELGSISAAARAMRVSYRAAWKWIEELGQSEPEGDPR